VPETEANDAVGTADVVGIPPYIAAPSARRDQDWFSIAATAGQTVVAQVVDGRPAVA